MSSLAILLAAASVVSQANAVTPKVPADALGQLGYFVGEWTAEYTIGDSARFKLSFRWAPGRHMFAWDGSGSSPVIGEVLGSGIGGWDANEKKIRICEFWSNGVNNRYLFAIESPDLLAGIRETASADGMLTTGKAKIEKHGRAKFTLTVTDDATGKAIEVTNFQRVETKR